MSKETAVVRVSVKVTFALFTCGFLGPRAVTAMDFGPLEFYHFPLPLYWDFSRLFSTNVFSFLYLVLPLSSRFCHFSFQELTVTPEVFIIFLSPSPFLFNANLPHDTKSRPGPLPLLTSLAATPYCTSVSVDAVHRTRSWCLCFFLCLPYGCALETAAVS